MLQVQFASNQLVVLAVKAVYPLLQVFQDLHKQQLHPASVGGGGGNGNVAGNVRHNVHKRY